MTEINREVRAARDPKFLPGEIRVAVETEIFPDGVSKKIGAAYLRNGQCPLACVYCALYRTTSDRPASGEEISGQLRQARSRMPGLAGIKLYNASSLFEPQSIRQTPDDLAAIAAAVADLELVVVEARSENAHHAPAFARRLSGQLEVAIGLEAADDELLRKMNKPTTVARFCQAARILRDEGVLLRTFILVGTPFLSHGESARLAVKTARLAIAEGARVISLLPVVSFHTPMENLRATGTFSEISREEFFETVSACEAIARGHAVVVAETEWLDRLPERPA